LELKFEVVSKILFTECYAFTKMKTSRFLLLLTCLVVVVWGGLWAFNRAASTESEKRAPSIAASENKTRPGAGALLTKNIPQSEPAPIAKSSDVSVASPRNVSTTPNFNLQDLPPFETPFSDTFKKLNDLANQGFRPAQCRLAVELAECLTLDLQKKGFLQDIASAAAIDTTTPEYGIAKSAALHASTQMERLGKLCAGVDRNVALEGWRHLFAAAKAGHTPSALRFAFSPPLDETNFLQHHEAWTLYKEYALQFLHGAHAAGEPVALFYLGWVYAGYPMPGGVSLIPADNVQAYAFFLASRYHASSSTAPRIDRALVGVSAKLSPNDLSNATLLAEPYKLTRLTVDSAKKTDYAEQSFPYPPVDCYK
jgi:hypothetical protein